MAASTSLTPTERQLRASVAGSTGWANMPAAERSARARNANRGIWEKYFRATDSSLSDAQRAKMADSAYRAHYKRMSFRSAKLRRLRKEAREREAQAMREARQAETLDGGAA